MQESRKVSSLLFVSDMQQDSSTQDSNEIKSSKKSQDLQDLRTEVLQSFLYSNPYLVLGRLVIKSYLDSNIYRNYMKLDDRSLSGLKPIDEELARSIQIVSKAMNQIFISNLEEIFSHSQQMLTQRYLDG